MLVWDGQERDKGADDWRTYLGSVIATMSLSLMVVTMSGAMQAS